MKPFSKSDTHPQLSPYIYGCLNTNTQVAFKAENLKALGSGMSEIGQTPYVAVPQPKGSSELYIAPPPMITD